MTQRKKPNPVRLYRFYNFHVGKHGEPFSLCDDHKENYKVPDNCVMECLADKAKIVCNLCDKP